MSHSFKINVVKLIILRLGQNLHYGMHILKNLLSKKFE